MLVMSDACTQNQGVIQDSESWRSEWECVRLISLDRERDNDIVLFLARLRYSQLKTLVSELLMLLLTENLGQNVLHWQISVPT